MIKKICIWFWDWTFTADERAFWDSHGQEPLEDALLNNPNGLRYFRRAYFFRQILPLYLPVWTVITAILTIPAAIISFSTLLVLLIQSMALFAVVAAITVAGLARQLEVTK